MSYQSTGALEGFASSFNLGRAMDRADRSRDREEARKDREKQVAAENTATALKSVKEADERSKFAWRGGMTEEEEASAIATLKDNRARYKAEVREYEDAVSALAPRVDPSISASIASTRSGRTNDAIRQREAAAAGQGRFRAAFAAIHNSTPEDAVATYNRGIDPSDRANYAVSIALARPNPQTGTVPAPYRPGDLFIEMADGSVHVIKSEAMLRAIRGAQSSGQSSNPGAIEGAGQPTSMEAWADESGALGDQGYSVGGGEIVGQGSMEAIVQPGELDSAYSKFLQAYEMPTVSGQATGYTVGNGKQVLDDGASAIAKANYQRAERIVLTMLGRGKSFAEAAEKAGLQMKPAPAELTQAVAAARSAYNPAFAKVQQMNKTPGKFQPAEREAAMEALNTAGAQLKAAQAQYEAWKRGVQSGRIEAEPTRQNETIRPTDGTAVTSQRTVPGAIESALPQVGGGAPDRPGGPATETMSTRINPGMLDSNQDGEIDQNDERVAAALMVVNLTPEELAAAKQRGELTDKAITDAKIIAKVYEETRRHQEAVRMARSAR